METIGYIISGILLSDFKLHALLKGYWRVLGSRAAEPPDLDL